MDFTERLNQSRGYEAFAEKEQEMEERQKNYVNRFWLKAGQDARIVFLDDNPPIIEEHQVPIDGDWRNWFTCLRMVNEACPICDNLTENNPYTVGFYTIIDMSEWTDKQGKLRKNELKLFPAKFQTLQKLKILSNKQGGSLAGCIFDVNRTTAEAANTGDMFTFEGKVTKADILKLNPEAKPFNYAEILEPKSAADLMKVLKKATKRSSSRDNDYNEDDIKW